MDKLARPVLFQIGCQTVIVNGTRILDCVIILFNDEIFPLLDWKLDVPDGNSKRAKARVNLPLVRKHIFFFVDMYCGIVDR